MRRCARVTDNYDVCVVIALFSHDVEYKIQKYIWNHNIIAILLFVIEQKTCSKISNNIISECKRYRIESLSLLKGSHTYNCVTKLNLLYKYSDLEKNTPLQHALIIKIIYYFNKHYISIDILITSKYFLIHTKMKLSKWKLSSIPMNEHLDIFKTNIKYEIQFNGKKNRSTRLCDPSLIFQLFIFRLQFLFWYKKNNIYFPFSNKLLKLEDCPFFLAF